MKSLVAAGKSGKVYCKQKEKTGKKQNKTKKLMGKFDRLDYGFSLSRAWSLSPVLSHVLSLALLVSSFFVSLPLSLWVLFSPFFSLPLSSSSLPLQTPPTAAAAAPRSAPPSPKPSAPASPRPSLPEGERPASA